MAPQSFRPQHHETCRGPDSIASSRLQEELPKRRQSRAYWLLERYQMRQRVFAIGRKLSTTEVAVGACAWGELIADHAIAPSSRIPDWRPRLASPRSQALVCLRKAITVHRIESQDSPVYRLRL